MKKRNSHYIKAIVFDVGGVLALGENSKKIRGKFIHSGVHIDIAKKLNISLDQYMDAIDTNYALAIEGKISRENVISIFSRNLKVSEDKIKKLYIGAYRKHFNQNKQLFKQAFKLKKLGYKIAILSDQWYLSKEALMPNKYYSKFNHVIVSCDIGLRKPNPKIYKILIKKLNQKPEEILFIDNQVWNTKPANKIGIKTILFKNNKQLFENKIWRRLFER
jgi:epoxide hydrolase-like predicted phosphatase